jgi:hypothetical protein
MSYLDTPRICFLGTFTAAGPTKNNLVAALDDPKLVIPVWDNSPNADGDFRILDGTRVVGAWDANGDFTNDPDVDPIIGQAVTARGKMADLDPEHRRVTDLIGAFLAIAVPPSGPEAPAVSGTMAVTQLRDYWNNISGVTVTSWQSVIPTPQWPDPVGTSPVIDQLRQASPDMLSVKLTLYAAPASPPWTIVGVIGPAWDDEPRQFTAARRLITVQTGHLYLPFPVATFQLDDALGKLLVDLSNLTVDRGQAGTCAMVQGVTASVLKTGSDDVEAALGPARDLTQDELLATAGLLEWDLTPEQASMLASRRLQLTLGFQCQNLVMQEHRTGKYVDVDRRSLRLNPGESATVRVYARQLGMPLPGQVVEFGLKQQLAWAPVQPILEPDLPGFPSDRYQLINSVPANVLVGGPGPLRVTTGVDGNADLTIQVKPGTINLPDARKTIDSQLYFLGDPEGWQTWGAIGPSNGDLCAPRIGAGCALSVLVFNTHPAIKDPTWDDVKPWLARYAWLYPAMLKQTRLDLSDKAQVTANAREIYDRIGCRKFDDIVFMPITRDLSKFRRDTILAYLRPLIKGPVPGLAGP